MDIITTKPQPTSVETFSETCNLEKMYEVNRLDIGKTIQVELKNKKENFEKYQFPYTEQGLKRAKNYAFELYKKTAEREYKSHLKAFSSPRDRIILFLVKRLGYKPEYKKTIKSVEERLEKASQKMSMTIEAFEKEKLIIKELPDTLYLNKLMSLGDKIYLLEVGRLLENEGITITEMMVDEILVYSNLQDSRENSPDYNVHYATERFMFNFQSEYKNHPERIMHSYLNQALFFNREDAEKEKERIITKLQKDLELDKNILKNLQ